MTQKSETPKAQPEQSKPPTPLANFEKLEAERQREWLFFRHRKVRPSWKRD